MYQSTKNKKNTNGWNIWNSYDGITINHNNYITFGWSTGTLY